MSSPTKIATSPASAATRGQFYRAAIVGASTLRGKEVNEMLSERNFPALDVRLLDDDESIGQLEATGDEINFIQSVRVEQFTNMDFTFFAADGSELATQAAPSSIFQALWRKRRALRSARFGRSASAARFGSQSCSRRRAW